MDRLVGYKPHSRIGAGGRLNDLAREFDSDELARLAETFFDVIIERNKALRILNGMRRQLAIDKMKCSTCDHTRSEHRSEHNQMYQWFDACEQCECGGWEHEWGDPHLDEVLTFIDLMTGERSED